MEVSPGRLIQKIGAQAVEIDMLRERVQTLEAALDVATKKDQPEPGEPKPEKTK